MNKRVRKVNPPTYLPVRKCGEMRPDHAFTHIYEGGKRRMIRLGSWRTLESYTKFIDVYYKVFDGCDMDGEPQRFREWECLKCRTTSTADKKCSQCGRSSLHANPSVAGEWLLDYAAELSLHISRCLFRYREDGNLSEMVEAWGVATESMTILTDAIEDRNMTECANQLLQVLIAEKNR